MSRRSQAFDDVGRVCSRLRLDPEQSDAFHPSPGDADPAAGFASVQSAIDKLAQDTPADLPVARD